MTDHQIIEGFLSGQSHAHAIVREWIDAVMRYLAQHQRLSIDDIVGDTLEKLLRLFREGSFKGESSLKTYVQRVAKYTVIDAVRRPAVMKVESMADNIEPATDDDPHTIAEAAEERGIYLRMLERISKGCRDIWAMAFAKEMSYKEIADQLHISVAAVKVRVFRCKEEATRIVDRLK